MTIRLCVFDCDGTLVDSQHTIIASLATAFAAQGLERPTAHEVRRVVGLSLVDAIAVLAPDAGPDTWREVSETYITAFSDLRRTGAEIDPLYPGVVDGLDAIEAAGWILGMATGKSQRGARATLDSHGLLHRFTTIQTPDVAAGKPSPDMVLRAMDETGASPGETAVIGDTAYDMMMARDAHAMAIGVAWGYHESAELLSAGAAVVLRDFSEVLPALERLIDGRDPDHHRAG